MRDLRLLELKTMLLARDYRPGMIDSAIRRARDIPRLNALEYTVTNKQTRRPVFVVSFDPRLPSITAIQHKHWRAMTVQDYYLRDVFPEPPLTAYKRPKNIRDLTIRAKLPSKGSSRPKRNIKGMKRCNKPCPACPYVMEGKSVISRGVC